MFNHTPVTSRRRLPLFAGAVVSGALVLGAALPAGAQTGADGTGERGDRARTACLGAIDKRIAALDKASETLSSDKHLTDGHRDTLTTRVDSAHTGIEAIRPQVESAAADQLKQLCSSVATDYRVFAVLLPQVHLARIGDAAAAAQTRADGVSAKIDEAIGRANAAGKNVDAATEAADALDDAVAKLGTDAQGLADQALAITPADFNGDKDVMDPLREKGKAVRADGKAVRAAAKTVRTELKALRG